MNTNNIKTNTEKNLKNLTTIYDYLDLFPQAIFSPQHAAIALLELSQQLARNPEIVKFAQIKLVEKLLKIQMSSLDNFLKCFNYQEHDTSHTLYSDTLISFVNEFYESISQWIFEMFDKIQEIDIDKNTNRNCKFYAKQYISSLNPKNFAFLNPEILQQTICSNGKNLTNGFEMMLKDFYNGMMTTTDTSAFSIGKQIATTSGQVIYQNELIELIQYSPSTNKTFSIPLLFIPPWINKYYILDLTPERSFIKWMIDAGYTVFMISWVNPNKNLAHKDFQDYVIEGVISSLLKIQEIVKTSDIHTVGYCVGGTLLTATLAYLKKSKKYKNIKIKSATLITTLLDFSNPGDMGVFITEHYIQAIEKQINKTGYLDARTIFHTFSVLRSDDMIWRYFVNNYMLGKNPPPNPILFWNAKPNNITKAMQRFLLVQLYKNNLLIKPNGISICQCPIDLSVIDVPIYMASMQKDHLIPWESSYEAISVLKTVKRFVLGKSGHVAGVINHPIDKKYGYYATDGIPKTASSWFKSTKEFSGSWWEDWAKWLSTFADHKIEARKVLDGIRPAPGKYVCDE